MFLFLVQKSNAKARVSMLSPGWSQAPPPPQAPFPSPVLGGLRNGDAGQHGEGCPP